MNRFIEKGPDCLCCGGNEWLVWDSYYYSDDNRPSRKIFDCVVCDEDVVMPKDGAEVHDFILGDKFDDDAYLMINECWNCGASYSYCDIWN
jgi:hypothetical protein